MIPVAAKFGWSTSLSAASQSSIGATVGTYHERYRKIKRPRLGREWTPTDCYENNRIFWLLKILLVLEAIDEYGLLRVDGPVLRFGGTSSG